MNAIDNPSNDVIEALFKAFSHPARLAILEELRLGEHCVCHLEAMLGARQSYVSQQLAVLREAGLICDRRDGWNVYYQVKDLRVFDLLDAAYEMTGKKPEPHSVVQGCPCPRCNQNLEKDVENDEYKGTRIRVC
jgi:DNA-binding transcriptional ArsR family regulator